jgi:glycine reductase complex component B subunit alpha and beta
MRLEIACYPVEQVVAGEATRLAGRTLAVDMAGLQARLASDPRVANLTVHLVMPGESVRIARVMEVVEPRVKVSGAAGDFPGILSPSRPAGSGRVHALKGVAVTACNADHASVRPLIDMAGEGARVSDRATLHHVVLVSGAPAGVSAQEHQRGLLEAALQAAVLLGAATLDQAPADVEVFDLPPLLAPAPPDLPRVSYIALIRSLQQWPLDDEPVLYGSNVRGLLPTLLHPNELLDGALVHGYHLFQVDTYAIQNHPVVRALAARHGRDLWVSGVIATVAAVTGPERDRNLALAVRLATEVLGLDGVIVTKISGGMPETDLMMLAEGCEEAGVKTALVVWERLTQSRPEAPLTLFSPRADAIASTGDRDVQVHLGAVERVLAGRDAADAGPLALNLYEIHGTVNQLGAGHFSAVDY